MSNQIKVRNLVFAEEINRTSRTGIVDVTTSKPEIFCFCDERVATIILERFTALEKKKKLTKRIQIEIELDDGPEFQEQDFTLTIDEIIDFIGQCDNEEQKQILEALDASEDRIKIETIEDKLKYEILKDSFDKYSLHELERRLL